MIPRIFEALILLAILYAGFRFLIADIKILNKKIDNEVKKGDENEQGK